MNETRWVVCDDCGGEGKVYYTCVGLCYRSCRAEDGPCERPEPCGCEDGMIEVEVEPVEEAEEFEEFINAMPIYEEATDAS